MNEIEKNVIAWAQERGIYEHSTAQAQLLKAVSEMGELADAVIKGDRAALIDGIGDVIVCLTQVAYMSGTDLNECYTRAWGDIKDRRGKMVASGAWVKE